MIVSRDKLLLATEYDWGISPWLGAAGFLYSYNNDDVRQAWES